MFSPDKLLRTQFAMREEITRTKLSPLLRASTRLPHTQSKFFIPSSKRARVLRIVLQIGIQRDDDFAARSLHPGPHRGGLTAIVLEPQSANARVGGRDFLEDLPGVILAAIVRDDDFVSAVQWRDGIADGFDQRAQIVLLVVAGNDKGKFRRFGHSYLIETGKRGKTRAKRRD